MSDRTQALVQAARAAANGGRWEEAERLWMQVRTVDPTNGQALYSLGVHHMQRGDFEGALALLAEAAAVSPADPSIPLMAAAAHRHKGDAAAEWAAIGTALAIDAYDLAALLIKADWLERNGRPRAAAAAFRNALTVAGPEARWPPGLRDQLGHARKRAEQHAEALAAHLEAQVGPLREGLSRAEAERWREAAAIAAGRSRPYVVDANQLHVPRLPAIPFFEREHFPWAAALEARTDAIRGELDAALAANGEGFAPYIAYRPGDPVNQWRELNHSARWSSYPLWRGGAPVDEHLAQCPQTAAALAEVEMAQIAGLCPNAMFSALAPRTRIPPHHGETNARLVVHLPLVVPSGCSYRVGFEERRWEVGRLLIFDDTLEHEARNDGDALRVVLIFDVWNPLLSRSERTVVQAITAAVREFAEEG